ncbi:predicted protein [Chaetoceros tenuissimus]|uniref:Uncharacterized protein n=1 Tax=Chaetoceros tenuissimus TaxID=426638 RepID=A0AAD3CHI4_9STRA|nr:predicted protein [Chaetoceros tenuissimus]
MEKTLLKLAKNRQWNELQKCVEKNLKKKNLPKNCLQKLLLDSMKNEHFPLELFYKLVPHAKLSTLRKSFEILSLQSSNNVITEMKAHIISQVQENACQLETIFFIAVKNDDFSSIHMIMDSGSQFLTSGFHDKTFHDDDLFHKMCDYLLSHPSILEKDWIFSTNLLHAVATRGHFDLARCICNMYPGTLKHQCNDGNIPLHCALERQQLNLAKMLLDKALDQNSQIFPDNHYGGLIQPLNKRKISALQLGFKKCDIESFWLYLSWLMEIGNNISCLDQVVDASLSRFVNIIDSINDIEELVTFFVRVESSQLSTFYRKYLFEEAVKVSHVLHTVAARGSPTQLQKLSRVLASNDVPYVKNQFGDLLIHHACMEKNGEMIEFLLSGDYGMITQPFGGLFEKNDHGITPIDHLLEIFFNLDEDILQASDCISTCIKCVNDLPILHYIIMKGHIDEDILEEFIEVHKPDPLCIWKHGKNAMHYAIDTCLEHFDDSSSIELLRLILNFWIEEKRKRNNVNVESSYRCPLIYSLQNRLQWDPTLKFLLESKSFDLEKLDKETGLKPFMIAANEINSLDCIYTLFRQSPFYPD